MANYIAEISKLSKKELQTKVETFFKRDSDADEEIQNVTQELKKIREQLAVQESRLVDAYAKKYSKTLTTPKRQILLNYREHYYNFPLCAEVAVKPEEESKYNIIYLYTKSGETFIPEGYALDSGSVVCKQYKYNISSDNSRVNLRAVDEHIYSFISETLCPMYRKSVSYEERKAILRLDAKEFVELFYDCEIDFKISFEDLSCYYKQNDCLENIFRYAPQELKYPLMLARHNTGPVPIHKLMGVEKDVYDEYVNNGIALALWEYKNYILDKATFGKTAKEWIDFIIKCKEFEDDLKFNKVSFSDYRTNSLLSTMAEFYLHHSAIRKNYTFGKFVKYVVEEAQNQGFVDIRDYNRQLDDYIRMCEMNGTTPILYTSYLSIAHDIAMRNHNICVTKEQEKLFKSRYDGFRPVSVGGFKILAPSNTDDIKHEGDVLSHCVASYIKKIIDNKTRVYFMRRIGQENMPLLTLEIFNGKITQAEGRSRRKPNADEKEALEKFAEKTGLILDYA